jgi:lipopolysaccharide heptosyltransferase II
MEQSSPFRRILIIKPSSLGDVIHALPVLHGLRRRFPDARIDWLLSSALIDLLDGHPDLDDIIPFDRKRFARVGWSLGVTREFIRFVRELRARRYDLIIDLQGLFRSGFMAWAAGASVRLGFADARELGWIFCNRRLRPPSREIHAAQRNYLVAAPLGFDDLPMTCDLPITDAERRRAGEMLTAAGVSTRRPIVAIAPGARWETKRWPPESFAALTDRLARDAGAQIVLLGGADETSLGDAIAAQSSAPVADLIGKTTLRELVAIVRAADLVVTNDSGTKDIAAALNRPLVCVYGPTSEIRTGPMLGRGRVVRRTLDCSPCYLKKLAQCPYGHECLRALDAEAVAAEALRMLRGREIAAALGNG